VLGSTTYNGKTSLER